MIGEVCSRCGGSRIIPIASTSILNDVTRGRRATTNARPRRGSGDNVIMRKLCSITIRFSGYYGPIPKSRVINFIAENQNVSVREASYIGVVGLSGVRGSELVRTR